MAKSRTDDLFDRLHAQGLRKRTAKLLSQATDRRRKPAKAVERSLNDVKRAVGAGRGPHLGRTRQAPGRGQEGGSHPQAQRPAPQRGRQEGRTHAREVFLSPVRAVVFERNGGPEVLAAKEVEDPTPGDGEVIVDVDAVGINYRDVYEREGRGYGSTPPAIIGVEGAGTIAGTGERVAWSAVPGSYAERVAANRDQLVPIPTASTPTWRPRRSCRA